MALMDTTFDPKVIETIEHLSGFHDVPKEYISVTMIQDYIDDFELRPDEAIDLLSYLYDVHEKRSFNANDQDTLMESTEQMSQINNVIEEYTNVEQRHFSGSDATSSIDTTQGTGIEDGIASLRISCAHHIDDDSTTIRPLFSPIVAQA